MDTGSPKPTRGRLRPRAPPPRAVPHRLAAAPRARRRVGHAALRGGRGGARAPQPARPRACRRSRSTRSSARSTAAAASSTARSGPPRPRCAARWERIAAARRAGRADAADRRLPDRRPALRGGRPPPRVRRPRARRHGHRGARARGARRSSAPTGSCSSATCRSSATSACSTSASRCPPAARARIQLSDEWRYAQLGDARRGVGVPREPRPRPAAVPRGDGRGVVPRGVRAGGRGPATRRASAARARRPSATCAIAMLRYLLLHTHEWTDEVVERLLGEVRAPERRATTRWCTRS